MEFLAVQEVPRGVKSIETECRWRGPAAGGREKKQFFVGTEGQSEEIRKFWGDKKVLETDVVMVTQ